MVYILQYHTLSSKNQPIEMKEGKGKDERRNKLISYFREYVPVGGEMSNSERRRLLNEKGG